MARSLPQGAVGVARRLGLGLILGLLAGSATAGATAITDPVGDFLPSFTGPHNGDLDVLTMSAFTDGATLQLGATLDGTLGTTPGALYVFGIDRGTNLAPFGAFRPGVLFDAVVVAAADGTGFVRDLVTGTSANLAPGSVSVNGNTLSVSVPVSLLPSEGFALSDYLANLWPRTGLASNSQIADFAPDNSDVPVTPAPEPASLTLLAAGLVGFVFARQRWRQ